MASRASEKIKAVEAVVTKDIIIPNTPVSLWRLLWGKTQINLPSEIKTKINHMRKLIYAINLTIDGCCDHTKGIVDDELLEYHTRLLRDADMLIYGRKTYQLMVPYWPDIAKNPAGESKADIEFARAFVATGKIVFSRTLDKAEETNTRIIRSNLQNEILKLKQEQGKNMIVGGVDIPTQLVELGLVDEYCFVVHPVIAGGGRRLFDGINLPESLKLKLVDSTTLKGGQMALRYLKH